MVRCPEPLTLPNFGHFGLLRKCSLREPAVFRIKFGIKLILTKMVERLGVVIYRKFNVIHYQIIFTPDVSTADCCLLQWYGIQGVSASFMRVVTGDDKMMCE